MFSQQNLLIKILIFSSCFVDPFDYTGGSCFDFAVGRHQAEYSRTTNNEGLCMDNAASIVEITENELELSICNDGGPGKVNFSPPTGA